MRITAFDARRSVKLYHRISHICIQSDSLYVNSTVNNNDEHDALRIRPRSFKHILLLVLLLGMLELFSRSRLLNSIITRCAH